MDSNPFMKVCASDSGVLVEFCMDFCFYPPIRFSDCVTAFKGLQPGYNTKKMKICKKIEISIASDLSIPLAHAKSPGTISGSHQKSLKTQAAFANFGAKSHHRSELGSDLDQQEHF